MQIWIGVYIGFMPNNLRLDAVPSTRPQPGLMLKISDAKLASCVHCAYQINGTKVTLVWDI